MQDESNDQSERVILDEQNLAARPVARIVMAFWGAAWVSFGVGAGLIECSSISHNRTNV
jgi:hypothetical protein